MRQKFQDQKLLFMEGGMVNRHSLSSGSCAVVASKIVKLNFSKLFKKRAISVCTTIDNSKTTMIQDSIPFCDQSVK